MLSQGQAGPQIFRDGSIGNLRTGLLGDLINSPLHGKFFEANYRNTLYSGGMTTTSISNVTFTTATLGATGTPIVGVWNPATSVVNLVITQVFVLPVITAATSTGPGALMWATSTGNAAISTGNAPLNRRTLTATGSQAKDMSGVALTGITNNLTVRHASGLPAGASTNFSFVGTAVGAVTLQVPGVELIEGAWIVPPGGILALLSTTTAVAHSAASAIVWEEVPV